MRMFGLIGLVLALLIVGVLVKKQSGSIAMPAAPNAAASGGADASHAPHTSNAPTVRAQGQQAQEAFKQSLDAAMQQPRAMPDEAR